MTGADSQVPRSLATSPGSVRWFQLAILIFLLAIGALLRFDRIQQESQFPDEFWSVYLSTGRGGSLFLLPTNQLLKPPPQANLAAAPSWPHVWTGMKNAIHPPLYHVVLRWWMDLFGQSDLVTRGLSAVLSLCGVVVLFDCVRRTSGSAEALFAAAIMTLAVSQIDFSQQTRSYTMLALLLLLVAHVLIRIEQQGANFARLAELAIYASASALTHYLAVLALMGLAGYALLRLRARDRIKSIIAFFAAGVITLLTWLPWLLEQKKMLVDDYTWLGAPSAHLSAELSRAAFLLTLHLCGRFRDWQSMLMVSIAFSVLVYFLPPLLARRRPQTMIWWCWALSSILLLTLIDLFRQQWLTHFPKYTFLATPAICALVAARLPIRGWMGTLLPLAVIVCVGIGAIDRAHIGPERIDDWRGFSLAIDKSTGPDDPIVFGPNDFWKSPAFWYIAFAHYVPDSHRPIMMLDGPPSDDALAQLRGYPRIAVVASTYDQIARWFPDRQIISDTGTYQVGRVDLLGPAAEKSSASKPGKVDSGDVNLQELWRPTTQSHAP